MPSLPPMSHGSKRSPASIARPDGAASERLKELAAAAFEREREIEERWPEDEPANQDVRQRELGALSKELRHRFADVLASAQ